LTVLVPLLIKLRVTGFVLGYNHFIIRSTTSQAAMHTGLYLQR
jgi:hypothetical protein